MAHMISFTSSFVPSVQAITWLNKIFRYRTHRDISLEIDTVNYCWYLKCSGANGTITMPLLSKLYWLGNNPKLPCSKISTVDQGLLAIEPDLPAPGVSNPPVPVVSTTDIGLRINYDIPGFTYWMLARCEEVNPPTELLDTHQRFPGTASHAFQFDYLNRPIVDEWIGVMRQVISRLWPRLPLAQPQFQVVATHDVDAPSAYVFGSKRRLARVIAGDVLQRRDISKALSAAWIRLKNDQQLHSRDPFNTFDWLMDTSESAGIRSSFFFICGRTNPSFDALYEPNHPVIRTLMRRINKRGHEIGLHPSYDTFAYPERIVREAHRLQFICNEEGIEQSDWGGRMHYLRWQWPTTAYGWEQAGFTYDSTLTYADRPGFRCGTCHPYPIFDPVAQRQLQLIQKPLIMMERSVISSRYLGLGYGTAAASLVQCLKQRCRAVGGNFTFLWHNSHLSSENDRDLYRQLLNM